MSYGDKMKRLSPCDSEYVCGELAAILPKPERILDVGCGRGERIRALKRLFAETEIFGVDGDADMVNAACAGDNICLACAESLPFEDEKFDAALCECSLSLFSQAEKALEEMGRVLKDGGLLFAGELFAPLGGEDFVTAPDGGAVKKIYSREKIEGMARAAGFELLKFSDRSGDLAAMAAQMLLDGSLCECIGAETALLLRKLKASYGFWIFKKEDK